jgi:hypothetical protein
MKVPGSDIPPAEARVTFTDLFQLHAFGAAAGVSLEALLAADMQQVVVHCTDLHQRSPGNLYASVVTPDNAFDSRHGNSHNSSRPQP